MSDQVRDAFLRQQYDEGIALAQRSDLLELKPLPFGSPPDRFLADFYCQGLIRTSDGEVREANHFQVGIWFPKDYLRHISRFQVVTWLGPFEIFHPNIAPPFICLGRLSAGTSLVDLLYQCYEIITYQKVTMREDDALNPAACVWARQNQDRFPFDRRPLKRRPLNLNIETIT